MTFNWAVLVAYAAKTGTLSLPLFILYLGLIFWTVGYDTIYACQDMEDDAMVGIKSTALRFGGRVKLGIGVCYFVSSILITYSTFLLFAQNGGPSVEWQQTDSIIFFPIILPFSIHLLWQTVSLDTSNEKNAMAKFKSNTWASLLLICFFVFAKDVLWALDSLLTTP